MLIASTLLQIWLALRHIRHINAHKYSVPEAFRSHISLTEHQHAAEYTTAKTKLNIASILVGAGITLAFTLGGGLAWISSAWLSLVQHPLWHGVLVIASVAAISSFITLPLTLIATFGIEARFGFNTTTVRLFIIDQIKHLLLAASFGLPFISLVLWLLTSMGNTWWVYTGIAWVAFNLLMLWLYPSFIAPLFNRFQPLGDAALTARIQGLLTRSGFKHQGVFVVDGSKRSRHGNAYFTGWGKAKRIVFYDTLLKQLSADEIEAVLAHELGHFKLKHVQQRLVVLFALGFALLYLINHLINAPWFYEAWGIMTPTAPLGLLLAFMWLPAFTFPFTPLLSMWSRRHEYQADAFAAQEAHASNLTEALTKLYRDNASTLTPDPVYSAYYDSHPPASLRIAHLASSA